MFDNLTNGETQDNQANYDNNLLDVLSDNINYNLQDIINSNNKIDFTNAYDNINANLSDCNDKSILLQDIKLDKDLYNDLDDLNSFYWSNVNHKDNQYYQDMRDIKGYLKDYKKGNLLTFLN